MYGEKERISYLFKGRWFVSLWFGLGSAALAVMVNPSVIPYIVLIGVFQMTLNQPFTWKRLLGVDISRLARAHLYTDVIIITLSIHFFGGLHAGPLLMVYLLLIVHASLTLGPNEGLRSSAASLFCFFLMVIVEKISGIYYPPLYGPGAGWSNYLAMFLSTVTIFTVPFLTGKFVFGVINRQQSEIKSTLEAFQGVFMGAIEPAIMLDHEARVVQANYSASAIFNMDSEAMRGKILYDLVSGETADEFAVILQNVAAGERVAGRNLPFHPLGGESRVLEIGASPFDTGAGKPGSILALLDVTEKIRMAEELKRYSEELYRKVEERTAELEESREIYLSLFEKAAVPLCWLDPEGVLQSANNAFKNLTGMEDKDQGTAALVDLVENPRERAAVADALDRLRRGLDAPTRGEVEIKSRRGKSFTTEWFVRFDPLTDQILVSMIDITDRKLAERALKESEERYRTLVETSPDAINVTDLAGRFLMANRQSLIMGGFSSEEELLGSSAFDAVAPEDKDEAIKGMMKTLSEGTVRNLEYVCLKKDGTRYPAEMSVSILKNAGGDPVGYIGVTRDVSARRVAEDALKKSEERFRALIEHSQDVISIIDATGKILYESPAAMRILGYDPEELIGHSAFDFIRPSDSKEVVERFFEGLGNYGSTIYMDLTLMAKDGSEKTVEATVTNLIDNPIVGGYIINSRDITYKKELEEAREKLQEELVLARQLAAAGKMAAGVAHEMNSPLTAISFYTDALEKSEELSAEQVGKIQRIRESSDRLQYLISRLINFSSADRAELEPLDINEVISQVVDALSHEFAKRPEVELTLDLQDGLARVNGNKKHLFHMTSNLVVNALQAMGEKGGKVSVKTLAAPDAILLEVRDSGSGIEEKDVPNIFKPFFTSKAEGEGFGLGLAIVAQVARLHGAEVKVDSKSGEGSTFTVEFPLPKQSA